MHLPLDCKSGNTGLLCQHVSLHTLDNGLGRGLSGQFLRVIFIVDIVADTDELASVVGAGQENHSDTDNFGIGNARDVRGIGRENELVDADGDGADEKRVEFLVVLIAEKC